MDVQQLFVEAGVACVQADRMTPASFWLNDVQSEANLFTGYAEHPLHGRYLRHGALVNFDGNREPLKGPPAAGQHYQVVLAEVGYSEAEISKLLDDGVVWRAAD